MLAHTAAEARRLGLGVDLTPGTGWPFGGPNVTPEYASSKVVLKRYNLSGGETLGEPLPEGEWSLYAVISGPVRKVKRAAPGEVTNLAANRIADLDRRGVGWKAYHEINFVNKDYKPFDASGWPLRDSGLIGPVTLRPVRRIDPLMEEDR